MIVEYLKDRRILLLIGIVLVLASLDYVYGVHFGIEFNGGTQIPLSLEHPVNPDQMASLISTLQQRISTFGLKEVTIEGVGNSEVYVIIPNVSGSEVNSTISIIESQGIFQGFVNGRVAINGTGIIRESIGPIPSTVSNGNVTWGVAFYITQSAAQKFATVVFGQGNKPLYMYLDKPSNATVLLNTQQMLANQTISLSEGEAIAAIDNATIMGKDTIPVEFYTPLTFNSVYPFFKSHNTTYKEVILAKGTPESVISNLTALGYTVREFSAANISPSFTRITLQTGPGAIIVNSWPAIGLLAAPTLSPDITNGTVGQNYEISGPAPPTLPLSAKESYANNQSKMIASVLSGGALPVQVIVGTPTFTPATLGRYFKIISGVAALLAVIAVSAVIVARYRKLFLVFPILMTTFAELFIILSVIGIVGTIDLAAVAGMIAVVGTGVDAQIIITDELVTGKSESTMKTRLGNAFYIVWADAILLIIAMLPLLFSTSLVSIIGFSESTILGALLGVFITRPAYGAIVSIHYKQ